MGEARHCWCCTEWLGFGEDVCPRCGSVDRKPCGRGGCNGYLEPDDEYCGWCLREPDED
ncbi:MAG: hypothetical protein Ct9H300mP12_05560 [Acidimicrobiales bacterium]|nr:hypothetical protein [Actinomycetota bacterium]GIT45971.1 MAG: hypothetical protein Ct9H300mP12_05560 [Acidimicrobiales bacterium]